MQNLTAHYNILYNAREIIRLKEESYAASFPDNYNELLNVYPDTTRQNGTTDKDLEAAIIKAYKIINIKEQSHYIGDAYLILGKAFYLEGNFFNSVEYFSYVTRSFTDEPELVQEALLWKARSLMYLNQLPQAKLAIDSAFQNLNPQKRQEPDVYEVKLQYDAIVQDYAYGQDYADGEEMATKAISFCRNEQQRLRLTFILAQMQELDKKPALAYKNYTAVVKSNAPFELAFNASLNRIRIEENKNGAKTDKTSKLLALLKDPNNTEFKDQIYYKVAEIKKAENDIDGALKYYKLSVRASVKNQNQKGLSYLRIGEIYFKIKAAYLTAKKYYDSTLTTLPANYPGYAAIQKKGSNLQLLANQLQIITREDTLQSLARMDEKTRMALIDKMVSDKVADEQAAANSAVANSNVTASNVNSNNAVQLSNGGNSSFYFYNMNAVSQGYAAFKQKWGNRKLEDNWRRSSRQGADLTNTAANPLQANNSNTRGVNQGRAAKNKSLAESYRKELLQGLPLTPQAVAQSNIRIYNAYIELGGIYRDNMNDDTEAIATFEEVLKRFPGNANNAVVYYSLYRLYSFADPARAAVYKSKLLNEYPNTPFAKVISDPDYLKKLDDQNLEVTRAYNRIFDLFAGKKYTEVIDSVPGLIKKYPGNKYAAQLYYLQAVSAGHNEKVGPFVDSLQNILKKFPNDKLIDPLINQHINYINAHQAEMLAKNVAINGDDPNEVPFTLTPVLKEKASLRKKAEPYYETLPEDNKAKADVKAANKPVIKQQDSPPSLFPTRDTTNYLFVINVSTGTTNLASSRFGIGQFNRANYQGSGIKHLVMPVGGDNQLIYIGRFYSLKEVKKYAEGISPLLPDIMKVPKDKYSFFIITQENLNKLADKKTLDSYTDYYQKLTAHDH